MNNATHASSIKTNKKEEMVTMTAVKNSIVVLARTWESNRATKVIQMVAIAYDVSQSVVSKSLIELLSMGTLVLDGTKLRADVHKCDGCHRMVADDEISIFNEFIIACEDCNNSEAGKYVEGEEEGDWESAYDEYVESSATDMSKEEYMSLDDLPF